MKVNIKYLRLSFLIIFFAIQAIVGQTLKSNSEFFKLPENYCLTVNVTQDKSPVQFENLEVLVEKTAKTPILNWKLKNNSSKSVKKFVVAFKIKTNVDEWRKFGGGQREYEIGTDEKNDLILPKGIYQETNYPKTSLLPQEIHNLFLDNKEPEDKRIIIVYGMIKKVIFNDGSVYEEDNEVFRDF